MNFYILKKRMTPNSWAENEMTIVPDEERGEDRYSCQYCPKCHHILNVFREPPIRCEFEIAKPYFGDIVFTFTEISFSKRAKDLFLESGLKGIRRFERIEIVKLKTHNGVRKSKLPPMPEYYLAHIDVDGAFTDFKRSKAVFSPPIMPACEYCNHSPPLDGESLRKLKLRTYVPRDRIEALFDGGARFLYPNSHDKHMHIYVDAARWNGNNIFKLIGFGDIVADQTFVDWADGNNLKCCRFVPESEPCEDWGMYEGAEERFGPGLRYDLD
ncbi:MAG: hypothetical protein IJG60_03920 [Thermoguttaceae bacterium]|nr:hypothetical protein [Thermoguttaceae bacterium]